MIEIFKAIVPQPKRIFFQEVKYNVTDNKC